MKVLHTADLHLDRSFEGLKTIPKQMVDRVQQANQKTLSAIVDIAIKHRVDAVILAGDTFHQSRTSINTQAYFIDEMTRLDEENIPVIMTFGNHDYYVAERYWFAFPKNMFLFCKEQVETHYFMTKKQEKVAISSFSYEHSWIANDQLPYFPVKDASVDLHIGIYHGDTAKNGQQSYAPFSYSEMKKKGYDYWALGHIHQPQVVSAAPLIVYPGTPQGHTKKERAVQGVAIVTIEPGHATVTFESVQQIKWQILQCTLAQARNLQEAREQLLKLLLKKYEQKKIVTLIEMQMNETAHLGEEFRLAYENGELLFYLQEELLRQTNTQLFLFELNISDDEKQKKAVLPVAPELLAQLAQNYLQPAIFSNALEELLQNPLFTSAVQVNDAWRKRSVEQADQRITEDFVMREDQL